MFASVWLLFGYCLVSVWFFVGFICCTVGLFWRGAKTEWAHFGAVKNKIIDRSGYFCPRAVHSARFYFIDRKLFFIRRCPAIGAENCASFVCTPRPCGGGFTYLCSVAFCYGTLFAGRSSPINCKLGGGAFYTKLFAQKKIENGRGLCYTGARKRLGGGTGL